MNYRKLGKTNFNISEIALGTWQVGGKWGLPFNKIVCIIPGASKTIHMQSNLSVYDSPQLTPDKILEMNEIYEQCIKPEVHELW